MDNSTEPFEECETRIPSVALFNRAELPVPLARHISMLEVELRSYSNTEAQVKLLLREPLLLFSVQGIACNLPSKLTNSNSKRNSSIAALTPIIQDALAHPSLARPCLRSHSRYLGRSGNSYRCILKSFMPITHRTVGAVRNNFSYHKQIAGVDWSPETAIWSRYEWLKTLGEGHFGEVSLARERCSNAKVALKQFERSYDDKRDDDVDCDEGHILNTLGHPNLIRIFEVVECADIVHVVMEFAEGATLTKYSRDSARGPWIAGSLQQILSATSHCHQCSVVHGDLKPENILVGGFRPDGCPLCLVSDFGHASICVGSQRHVASVGDPRYISPETAVGKVVSERSDIFMLGMSTYELLTGGWLPFFQERAEHLESMCPFYDSTLAWFMVSKGSVHDRMRNGLSFDDMDRFQPCKLKTETEAWASPVDAQQLLSQMLAWQETDRPTAQQALSSPWIVSGSQACKAARAASSPAEFGLWAPQRSNFKEMLASRSAQPLAYRLLLAAVAMSLEPASIFSGRLLFRWMDVDAHGSLCEEDFKSAARKVNLDESIAADLFRAADIFEQGLIDFKDFLAVLVDPGCFSDAELASLMRAVLSRAVGPGAGEAPRISFETFASFFKFPSHHEHTNEMLDNASQQWRAEWISLRERDVSADTLVKLIRDHSVYDAA